MTKAMEIVKKARSDDKITGRELIAQIFPDFIELHGDRLGSDDPAIIGGLATLNNKAVTVISTDRGHSAQERIARHFGCPTPGGYRKSLRLAKQAAKFHRPIIIFVNTAGAYPGQEAEEQGQGAAIAQNLLQLGNLPVPIITVIFGEGGSGGALALACGDRVLMLTNSTYSVLSPEGFASIMYRDSSKAAQAAEIMQITPESLKKYQVIEEIIPESANHNQTAETVKTVICQQLKELAALTPAELLAKRKQRFRQY
ncbi:carboxyltransferase subunit alpha [Lactobacillus corticis]|uniref:acetyl-CoA carboxytransferase n=1 Tax=Lactobacillus corticis TaxID=2201249 RepID=A0A916QGJ9_9LACO|nr:carboxyltransferase subunit alpha [Lactobacillus corticis]GFZ26589.1 acetyl-CoA carboxylase, carboxyl transferase subunit alpha [Lactobacillus corticis]